MSEKTVRKFTKMKGFPAIILPHKILIDRNQLQTLFQRIMELFKISF